MKKNYITKISRPLVILLLLSLSIYGSDCNESVGPSVPGDYLGNWQLKSQTGALQDICPDEVLNLQSEGIANLTCPGSAAIVRDFFIENDILTYTQTTVSYDAELTESNNKLALYGRNVSRNLFYERIVPTGIGPVLKVSPEFINSSEVIR